MQTNGCCSRFLLGRVVLVFCEGYNGRSSSMAQSTLKLKTSKAMSASMAIAFMCAV